MGIRLFIRSTGFRRAGASQAVAAALVLATQAGAAEHDISLLPASQVAAVGEQISVELWWDFSGEVPLGGANDVFYDASKLRYISYTPEYDDGIFVYTPSLRRSELNGMGATGLCMPPVVHIGTIIFEAIREGSALLRVEPNDEPVGPPVSCSTFLPYPEWNVNLNGAVVEIGDLGDSDGDGVLNISDNCTNVFNASQYDSNGDNIGNVCDPDIAGPASDEDCTVNFLDLSVLKSAFFSNPASPGWSPHADFDGNGVVNFLDLEILGDMFFGPPGPSAAGCN